MACLHVCIGTAARMRRCCGKVTVVTRKASEYSSCCLEVTVTVLKQSIFSSSTTSKTLLCLACQVQVHLHSPDQKEADWPIQAAVEHFEHTHTHARTHAEKILHEARQGFLFSKNCTFALLLAAVGKLYFFFSSFNGPHSHGHARRSGEKRSRNVGPGAKAHRRV